MEDIYFANPEFLWLLILIPLLSLWHYYNKGKVKAKLSIPTLKAFESVSSLIEKLNPILFIFNIKKHIFLAQHGAQLGVQNLTFFYKSAS